MLKTLLTGLLLATLLAVAAAPAEARKFNVRIGIGDQNRPMFDEPRFRALKIRKVRYFIPWNAMRRPDERLKARAWVKAARAAKARPLLHVSTHDLRPKKGRAPSVRRYRKDITRMVRYFHKLGVRDFGAWNEANHKTQPTWNKPRRAARYFKVMRRAVFRRCSRRKCRVVGLDVLDQRGVSRYIRRFVRAAGRRYTRRHLRIVGVHNYSDVNRKRTRGLRGILRTVRRVSPRAKLWLTETGGVVKFGRSFPCSEKRAAKRLGFLFKTVRRHRRSIRRVYLYNWYGGAGCELRFDAGLMNASGEPRPGYKVVRRKLKSFKR